MRTILLAAALMAWGGAHAADAIPPHLTGVWGTSPSLFEGDSPRGESQLHLDADGLGLMAGSTPPPHRLDGQPEEGRPPRAIIGFLVRARVDGDVLTAQAFLPDNAQADMTKNIRITCRYAAAGPTLNCPGPDGVPIVMRRYAQTLPADSVKTLAAVRGK